MKCLEKLQIWLKICKYPDHIISKSFHKSKLWGPAPKPNDKPVLSFVTTYHGNIDNLSLMSNIRKKINYTPSEDFHSLFNKESNMLLAQRLPKNLLRIPSSPSVTSTSLLNSNF